MRSDSIIEVKWDAPTHIKAYSTTRIGGVSEGSYASLNLATHVADEPESVMQNRQRLSDILSLPTQPLWLNQVHSTQAIHYSNQCAAPNADTCISNQKNQICVVMTADCLPILLCNQAGTEVAAVHAGWRGLQAGVIDQAIMQMTSSPNELLAWIGPAIGAKHYQLNTDIRQQFIDRINEFEAGFYQDTQRNCFADMFKLASINLAHCGVTAIYGEPICTYSDSARFFSYRRDGITGRMASLIYFQ